MTGIGFLHHINRKKTDGVYSELINLCGRFGYGLVRHIKRVCLQVNHQSKSLPDMTLLIDELIKITVTKCKIQYMSICNCLSNKCNECHICVCEKSDVSVKAVKKTSFAAV